MFHANGLIHIFKVDVVCIKDNQPMNPYTEIQVLAQHTDIVRLLIRITPYRLVK